MADLRSMIEIQIVRDIKDSENKNVYRMYVPQGVPYAEAQEVALEFNEVIKQWEKHAAEVAEKAKNQEALDPELVESQN